jgi:ZIP family zinc transporter
MTVFLIILATAISTLLGGLFAIKLKDKLHLILGFSAGAVLGVALFDLLPESIELAGETYGLQLISIAIAAGFVTYMFLDRFFSFHNHGEDDCKNPRHSKQLGAAALVIHSCFDGLGIGLAFKVSPEIGWVVALAVLAHDFSDGINTVNLALRNNAKRKTVIKWLILASLAPAVGFLTTLFFSVSAPILGLILAVFIGLFLYISASDLIPESHHRHPAIWTTLSTVLGIMVIFLAVQFAK